MNLRFFCDQCVPRAIGEWLRELGADVRLLKDYLPTRAPDSQVIAKAQELDSILLSLNGDFADIVAYPRRAYRGIIALQLHDRPETIPSLLTGLRPAR